MQDKSVNPVHELIDLLRPHRLILGGVLLCFVALAFLDLAMPWLIGYTIDSVFKGAEQGKAVDLLEKRLVVVLLCILGIYLARNALYYLSKPATIKVGEQAAFSLRQKLIRHLHTLSVDFYQRNNPGKISARVMQDAQSVKQFIQDELAKAMINLLMVIGAAAIMLYVNWFLALITMAVMPLHLLVYYLFRKPIGQYAREAKARSADVSGSLVEQFDAGGAATVKAAATQLLEQEKLRRSLRRSMDAQIKEQRFYTLQKVAADLLVGLGTIVLFGVGGYQVLHNPGMSPGDFVAFLFYVKLLYPRLIKLTSQAGKLTRSAASVERVGEIIRIQPSVAESEGAIPAEITEGKIEFRHVTFGYNSEPVLMDISFTVAPKDHVLVLGASGAGKSTLVNLIPRFYDPTEGQILIDGTDLRDFTLNALRQQIGFVFQDCFLFNDTIMGNIRYAWPQASDEQVIEAAQRAYADEFIEKLPEGYMTVVGEDGLQLSAGQKRRLMVARAILKNPKILIMDEPLISLDPDSRGRVIDGISSLIRNRTVLTITHYPDELPYAHKQAILRDGRLTVRSLSGRVIRSG